MTTDILYEYWRQRYVIEGLQKGRKEGRDAIRRSFRAIYESRFGSMPPAVVAALDTTGALWRLESWLPEVATGSAELINATLTRDIDEDRDFLMATESLFEQWREQHRAQGLQQGREEACHAIRRSLRAIYESRFGPMPPTVVAALDATRDLSCLASWLPKIAIGSAEEIAAILTRSADT